MEKQPPEIAFAATSIDVPAAGFGNLLDELAAVD